MVAGDDVDWQSVLAHELHGPVPLGLEAEVRQLVHLGADALDAHALDEVPAVEDALALHLAYLRRHDVVPFVRAVLGAYVGV